MSNPIRATHLAMLKALLGTLLTPFIGTGSRSMFEMGLGEGLLLLCTGNLDRQGRLACHLRTCDAEALLATPGSVLSCYWPQLAAPLVIPAAVLEAPLARLRPTGANQLALKLRAKNGQVTLVPTETKVDQFANAAYLVARHAMRPVPLIVPRLTHAQWQSLVAAVEHIRGCDVAVPANDRTRLNTHALDTVRLMRVDVLPVAVRSSRAVDVDVVATPRGGEHPIRLFEVEHRNDIRAALHRCAQVMAHLQEAGVRTLPRVVIVADESRRMVYNRYVAEAPLPSIGFTARCEFRSFADVYRDARQLLPHVPANLWAA